MGAKVSGCQASLCFKEAKVRCSCSNIRLCNECFDLHKREKPQLNHRPTAIDVADQNPTAQTTTFSMANLEILKELYRSPDGSTIVHEAKVKGREGERVAVKCMVCRTEQEYQKKLKEATLQQSLKHPNICSCLAHFLDEEFTGGYRFVMVLEYSELGDVEEDTVGRRLRNVPYLEKELIKHMTDLIDAFAFLQDRSLIHGDIKPKNIFIANDGLLKIGDFGESRQGLQLLMTQTTQIRGTIAYFSPLLFQAYIDTFKGRNTSGNVRHNSVKSDVFSLGLTFLHMALLSKPLELNNLELGQEALQKDIDVTIIRLRYGKKVKQILGCMLQVQESKRYDFKQLRNLLNELFPQLNAGLFDSSIPREGSIEEERIDALKTLPLIAVSNNPSKAFMCVPGVRQTRSLISQKFKPSCKCCFISPFTLIITGGVQKPQGVFEMNVENLEVTARANLNEGRLWHSICFLDNEVYVIAGRSPAKLALSSVEVLRKDRWQLLAPLLTPRDSATAVVHDGKILVAGGATNRAGRWELLNSIEQFQKDHWVELNVKLPCKVGGVGLLSISSNSLLVCGGYMNKGALSDGAWSIDVTSGNTTELPPLPEGDSFSSMTSAMVDGRFILLSTLTGLFEYDHSSRQWNVSRYLVKT